MEAKIATVSQINSYLKRYFDHNQVLGNIWIKGEISNFKSHYSGHLYITLKDEKSVLKAIMFKSSAAHLSFYPQDGMKVLARGRITVYEPSGAYQLYIEEMIPDGVGELYIAFEQLKRKLEEEGLFAQQYKKPIPRCPETVGVATAVTGAVAHDIINVITRRFPMTKIVIYPTPVQGAAAVAGIVEAIEFFNERYPVDTLIVGRGGGSLEDLWAFNEEAVARAIFASKIPIISAVGHETDFTIADFVADCRAPTPSAAAEIAVPSALDVKNMISMSWSRALRAVTKRIEADRKHIASLKMRTPKERIQDESIRLDNLLKSAEQSFRLKAMDKKNKLAELAGRLDALSPLQTLSRGYAIPMKPNGEVIRSAKKLRSGTEFTLKLKDGGADCVVK